MVFYAFTVVATPCASLFLQIVLEALHPFGRDVGKGELFKVAVVLFKVFQARPSVAPVPLAVSAEPLFGYGYIVIVEVGVLCVVLLEAELVVLHLHDTFCPYRFRKF